MKLAKISLYLGIITGITTILLLIELIFCPLIISGFNHYTLPISFFSGIVGLILGIISRRQSTEKTKMITTAIILNIFGILSPVYFFVMVWIALSLGG